VFLEGGMHGPLTDLSEIQGLADGGHYEHCLVQGCQADEGHTVGEEPGAIAGCFQGETRLSDPAYSRER